MWICTAFSPSCQDVLPVFSYHGGAIVTCSTNLNFEKVSNLAKYFQSLSNLFLFEISLSKLFPQNAASLPFLHHSLINGLCVILLLNKSVSITSLAWDYFYSRSLSNCLQWFLIKIYKSGVFFHSLSYLLLFLLPILIMAKENSVRTDTKTSIILSTGKLAVKKTQRRN